MNLVIVESPTKARKLSGYLGKEFKIEASVGHVRDLPKTKLGVDLENNYEPTYLVSTDKRKVVKKLKDEAAKADKIYLAMDPDREGEAIAWHVKHILQKSLKKKADKDQFFLRSTFHEITKKAVSEAIEKPGEINSDLVDAQQARRVLDRLVGYKVSPVLWRKIRRGLSAGRVQSVALRLIVEREKEREAFKPDEYWEVDVALSPAKAKLDLKQVFVDGSVEDDLPLEVMIARVHQVNGESYEPSKEADVKPVVKDLKSADYQVDQIERKERRYRSRAPFTTSTLQQTAAYALHFSSKKTMILAQQLYEEGLITYHRTDAVSLSKNAQQMARNHIKQVYGEKYLPAKARVFKGKSKNAQEAHEAIRVTDVKLIKDEVPSQGAKLGSDHARLYDLIWRRFVASQMTPAIYDQTQVLIKAVNPENKDNLYQLKTTGSVLKFDGWRKLFPTGNDQLLPELEEGEGLDYLDLSAVQKFTQPPARYNDASLVKELEKRGIGRPSTYASIISVIQDRGYVDKQNKYFLPTVIGTTVVDFLLEHFSGIMDYDFTAQMEDDLDAIARGEEAWKKVVAEFWEPMEGKIEKVIEQADRAKIPVEKTGETCPQCGKEEDGEIVIRTGRYGKFKSCSRFPDCDFTENLVETLGDRKCPLCKKGDIVIKNTRWGKKFYGCSQYPKCDWASWKEPEEGLSLTQEEWDKIQAEREKRKKKYKKKRGKKSGKSKKTAKSKAKTKSKKSSNKKAAKKK
ncbi:MAG: type I DNA topoisomerase [Candidatus Pacebacteria bacterium]|nr:type I DNA topoisomerase [Candidatus Paceibacterota bacterium]